MSVTTWIGEFYLFPAETVPIREAPFHSLQKWKGLTPKALAKHKLERFGSYIFDEGNEDLVVKKGVVHTSFHFSAHTCALCVHYNKQEADMCSGCPIKLQTGQSCMDDDSVFEKFSHGGTPIPMINLLKNIVKVEKPFLTAYNKLSEPTKKQTQLLDTVLHNVHLAQRKKADKK